MTDLPKSYRWLLDLKLPLMLEIALKYYGVKEAPGEADNPLILSWAERINQEEYKHDDRAWCALFMSAVSKEAGQPIPTHPLKSFNWINIGMPINEPELGDILIFKEKTGGHIGQYVGEGETVYHVLGGNQKHAVNIIRIKKEKLEMARRPHINMKSTYPSIQKYHLMKDGSVKE